ncbi:MerR family transcriptional regulator [Streptomyces sp. NPDC007346]|uniref:MerR family transcriptional regulator n=1 Tax=Streptomyces sp. NPDC007346 TaxID=3154682 RepID=UPI003453F836
MFTIGDFARYGRVSPRMLRHYDAIGLLRPDRTDPATGYRYYGAAQLARLNRIIALKDLGFTLQQVRAVLDEQVGPQELRGMLRLRRAELMEAAAAATARLAQVEARLRSTVSAPVGPVGDTGVNVVELPAFEAATIVHRGAMDDVLRTEQTLARWLDRNGYRSTGYNREVSLECPPDRSAWVTELQGPVTRI